MPYRSAANVSAGAGGCCAARGWRRNLLPLAARLLLSGDELIVLLAASEPPATATAADRRETNHRLVQLNYINLFSLNAHTKYVTLNPRSLCAAGARTVRLRRCLSLNIIRVNNGPAAPQVDALVAACLWWPRPNTWPPPRDNSDSLATSRSLKCDGPTSRLAAQRAQHNE